MSKINVGDFVRYTDAAGLGSHEDDLGWELAMGQVTDVTDGEIEVKFPFGTPMGWDSDYGPESAFEVIATPETADMFIQLALIQEATIEEATAVLEITSAALAASEAELAEVQAALEDATTRFVKDEQGNGTSLNEAFLRAAARFKRTVRFTYAKGDGNVLERRTLRPEAVYETLDNRLIVAGWDTDRDEPRCYRLDRIKGDVELVA